jgi:hypothetical protein
LRHESIILDWLHPPLQVFKIIREVCGELFLGEYVVDRACAHFSKFRDQRDKVQSLQLVIAGCILTAVEEEEAKRPALLPPSFPCTRCKEVLRTDRCGCVCTGGGGRVLTRKLTSIKGNFARER